MGKAFVATEARGVPEIIFHGQTCLLVPTIQPKAPAGQGVWYREMPLYAHGFLIQPTLTAFDLDRAMAQGYRVVVLSSTRYDRLRRWGRPGPTVLMYRLGDQP